MSHYANSAPAIVAAEKNIAILLPTSRLLYHSDK